MKKRLSLKKHFTITYFKALIYSVITSFAAVTAFYFTYRMATGIYDGTKNTVMLILADICIPLLCFIAYTLFFTGKLSRSIRRPLNELMAAVEKIKKRDLNFSIVNTYDDELGDLSRAFEDMRANLEDSLIREWRLEEERREMTAAITHDLRTPLAILKGHIEGLQGGLKYEGEKLDAYLDVMEQNINRAEVLIAEMNELVEIDSQGFELNRFEVDLVKFLKEKCDALDMLASRKDIAVELQYRDNRVSGFPVLIDANRLSQVLDNIVGNSLRFTPPGGVVIIEVQAEEKGAAFRICDTGPGFDVKDLKNIFKKFCKGDPSRSAEKGHSGLGLYISAMIVQKFGGSIKASNLPEGGACVEFSIYF